MLSEAIDALWDYDKPDESEARFLSALEATSDLDTQLALLTQIARAQGLRRRFDQAHATLDRVTAQLPNANEPSLRVRYLLELGRVFNSSGHSETAGILFLEALAAAEGEGEDAMAVDAAHMLGISEPPSERLRWNEYALALAERSHQPGAQRWQGSLYNNMGWTYHDRGEFETALALFEKALAFQETHGNEGDIRVARWYVARTLRSLGRMHEALAIQTQLLAQLTELDESDGYVNEEIAECLWALGRMDEARFQFGQAYALLSADPRLAQDEPARLERLDRLSTPEGD